MVWRSLKKLKTKTPYDPAITLLDIYRYEKNENTNSKRYTYFNVYSSTIYNSQDMEAIYVSIIRRINKEKHISYVQIYAMDY